MTKNNYRILLVCMIAVFCVSSIPPWGFFGHRKINRIAVFSLPPEMIVFYKHHIEFITEHAVDPDKRRYATPNEGVRHYIDIDHWGEDPFKTVPRQIVDAILKYASFSIKQTNGAIQEVILNKSNDSISIKTNQHIAYADLYHDFKQICVDKIGPDIYAGNWTIPLIGQDSNELIELIIEDHFVSYGIVPYHLKTMQRRLEKAFYRKDGKAILKYSAEIGHYIADACVPLHTTENYNGQLTNQIGIHAFWESRLPELFSETNYDLFVGKPDYIADVSDYFWKIVEESHYHLDSVLLIEKRLSQSFPSDEQYCFDDRLERTIRTQCEGYARKYMDEMDGMVEERMFRAIKAVSSSWYTAWIDAGSPNLSSLLEIDFSKEELDMMNQFNINKLIKFTPRVHEH